MSDHTATPPPMPLALSDPFLSAEEAEQQFQEWAESQSNSPDVATELEKSESAKLPSPNYSPDTQAEHGDYWDWEEWNEEEWDEWYKEWNEEDWED